MTLSSLSSSLVLSALLVGVVSVPRSARAADPAARSVITNTSNTPWKGLTVTQDGVTVCTVELAPGSTLVVGDQLCQVSAATGAPVAAAPAGEVDLLADEVDLLAEDEEPEVEAPRAPVRPSAIVDGGLVGRSTVSGGFGPARRIGIFNDTNTAWTGCTVVLNDEWSYVGPARLEPGAHEGIMGQRFVNATGDFMVKNHTIHRVRVTCNEGSGTFVPL